VGLAAVDVGRAMGLQVIAAASSADKRAVAAAHGAVATIDTSSEDVKTRTRELLAELGGERPADGVDLVYDPVGGALGEQSLRTLRDDGQFLVIGFASGTIPQLPANHVLLRNRRVTGVDWGGWVGRHQAENAAMLAEVVAAIGRGDLHPVEPVAYPFAEAARALGDQLQRRVTGKTVLVP
jgi:NADPH2:quinone reductase